MEQPAQPVLRDIVLIGGGHSHVGVLKRFAMNPTPGVRLTLICRDTHTPYSGMLPGYVAGHYAYDDVHIDLSRLAEFAGARFYRDEAVGLDRRAGKVLCRNRPPVPYDQLSINIGSSPQISQVSGAAEHAVPVKPITGFNDHWTRLLARMSDHQGPLNVAIVGGGAGGVELLLAMQYRLQNELRSRQRDTSGLGFHIFNAASQILPTHNDTVRSHFARVLAQRGVQVNNNSRVERVSDHTLHLADGTEHPMDEILWVTQAGGAKWLEDTGLELDASGCIKVNNQLQSLTDPAIFAAGDIATMVDQPREKAGVFAVRQGPPLAENLRRAVKGQPLKPYRAQKNWLALISTGNRFAIASRGNIGFAGAWVWRWKNWIDQRFMDKFNDLPPMTDDKAGSVPSEVNLNQEEAAQAISAVAMRCGGCGAKVGSTVLS
ncbi:MAG: bifunctional NADH dehydrogenase FAD-containing subunit/selenide, water dikinase SelD, partial [Halomonadaceae bacterium]